MTRKTYTCDARIYYQYDKVLNKFRVWNNTEPNRFEYMPAEKLAWLKAMLFTLGIEIAEVEMVKSFNA